MLELLASRCCLPTWRASSEGLKPRQQLPSAPSIGCEPPRGMRAAMAEVSASRKLKEACLRDAVIADGCGLANAKPADSLSSSGPPIRTRSPLAASPLARRVDNSINLKAVSHEILSGTPCTLDPMNRRLDDHFLPKASAE